MRTQLPLLVFLFCLLFVRRTSGALDTEIRLTGMFGFGGQVVISLEVSNVQARVHEIPPLLRIGERHGDILIKSADPGKGLVVLETGSGTIQLSVGRTGFIKHVPFGRAAHHDELFARYGDFVPPGRFRPSE